MQLAPGAPANSVRSVDGMCTGGQVPRFIASVVCVSGCVLVLLCVSGCVCVCFVCRGVSMCVLCVGVCLCVFCVSGCARVCFCVSGCVRVLLA